MGDKVNLKNQATQHIQSTLTNKQSVQVGRSGQMGIDTRFNLKRVRGKLMAGGYDVTAGTLHTAQQAQDAQDKRDGARPGSGLISLMTGPHNSYSYTLTSKDAKGNPVTILSTLQNTNAHLNSSDYYTGHIQGQIAQQIASELQARYGKSMTYAQTQKITPDQRRDDRLKIQYLATFLNSSPKLKAMYDNPTFNSRYPSGDATYIALLKDPNYIGAIQNIIDNHNRGTDLLREKAELDKLQHWRAGQTTEFQVGGKSTLETQSDYDQAISTQTDIDSFLQLNPNHMTLAQLNSAVDKLQMFSNRYDEIQNKPRGDRTLSERINFDSLDLHLEELKKRFVDFTTLKEIRERQHETTELEQFRIAQKQSMDIYIQEVRNLKNLKNPQLTNELDRLNLLAQTAKISSNTELKKFPHITGENNPPSVDYLILNNTITNWALLFRWIALPPAYQQISNGNFGSLSKLPNLRGYTPPAILTKPTTQILPDTSHKNPHVEPKQTFGDIVTVIDFKLKTQFSSKWSATKAPDTTTSTDRDSLEKAFQVTNTALQTDTKGMNLEQLKAFIVIVREAQGRQNKISLSKSDTEHRILINPNAISNLQKKMIQLEAAYNLLELRKEKQDQLIITNHKLIHVKPATVVIAKNDILNEFDQDSRIRSAIANKSMTTDIKGGSSIKTNNTYTLRPIATVIFEEKSGRPVFNTNTPMNDATKAEWREYLIKRYHFVGSLNTIDSTLITQHTMKTAAHIQYLNLITDNKDFIISKFNSNILKFQKAFEIKAPPTSKPTVGSTTSKYRDPEFVKYIKAHMGPSVDISKMTKTEKENRYKVFQDNKAKEQTTAQLGKDLDFQRFMAGMMEQKTYSEKDWLTQSPSERSTIAQLWELQKGAFLARPTTAPTPIDAPPTTAKPPTAKPNFPFITPKTDKEFNDLYSHPLFKKELGDQIKKDGYGNDFFTKLSKAMKHRLINAWLKSEQDHQGKSSGSMTVINGKPQTHQDITTATNKHLPSTTTGKLKGKKQKDVKFYNYTGEDREEIIDPRFVYPYWFDNNGQKTYLLPYHIKDGYKLPYTPKELTFFHYRFNFRGVETIERRQNPYLNTQALGTAGEYLGGAVGAYMALSKNPLAQEVVGFMGNIVERSLVQDNTKIEQTRNLINSLSNDKKEISKVIKNIGRAQEQIDSTTEEINTLRSLFKKGADQTKPAEGERYDEVAIEFERLAGSPTQLERALERGETPQTIENNRNDKIQTDYFLSMLKLYPDSTPHELINMFQDAPEGSTLEETSKRENRQFKHYKSFQNNMDNARKLIIGDLMKELRDTIRIVRNPTTPKLEYLELNSRVTEIRDILVLPNNIKLISLKNRAVGGILNRADSMELNEMVREEQRDIGTLGKRIPSFDSDDAMEGADRAMEAVEEPMDDFYIWSNMELKDYGDLGEPLEIIAEPLTAGEKAQKNRPIPTEADLEKSRLAIVKRTLDRIINQVIKENSPIFGPEEKQLEMEPTPQEEADARQREIIERAESDLLTQFSRRAPKGESNLEEMRALVKKSNNYNRQKWREFSKRNNEGISVFLTKARKPLLVQWLSENERSVRREGRMGNLGAQEFDPKFREGLKPPMTVLTQKKMMDIGIRLNRYDELLAQELNLGKRQKIELRQKELRDQLGDLESIDYSYPDNVILQQHPNMGTPLQKEAIRNLGGQEVEQQEGGNKIIRNQKRRSEQMTELDEIEQLVERLEKREKYGEYINSLTLDQMYDIEQKLDRDLGLPGPPTLIPEKVAQRKILLAEMGLNKRERAKNVREMVTGILDQKIGQVVADSVSEQNKLNEIRAKLKKESPLLSTEEINQRLKDRLKQPPIPLKPKNYKKTLEKFVRRKVNLADEDPRTPAELQADMEAEDINEFNKADDRLRVLRRELKRERDQLTAEKKAKSDLELKIIAETREANRIRPIDLVEPALETAYKGLIATKGATVGFHATRLAQPLVKFGYDYIFPTTVEPPDADTPTQDPKQKVKDKSYWDRVKDDVAQEQPQPKTDGDPDPDPNPDPDGDGGGDGGDPKKPRTDRTNKKRNIAIDELPMNAGDKSDFVYSILKATILILLKKYAIKNINKILRSLEYLSNPTNRDTANMIISMFNAMTGLEIPQIKFKKLKKGNKIEILPEDSWRLVLNQIIANIDKAKVLPFKLKTVLNKLDKYSRKYKKVKKIYNKILKDIEMKKLKDADYDKEILFGSGLLTQIEEYERTRARDRTKPILEPTIDPHTEQPQKPPEGFTTHKQYRKKPFDNFKRDSNGKSTGYRTLMKQIGTRDEQVQAQRRKQILQDNPEFEGKQFSKSKNNYNYNRIS